MATTINRGSILDRLREEAPAAYTMLHRPVQGQGGYQSRLRAIQADLGIDANPVADTVSPAQGKILHSTAPQADNVSAGWDVIGTIRALMAQGKHQLARAMAADVLGVDLPALGRQAATVDLSDLPDDGEEAPEPIKRRRAPKGYRLVKVSPKAGLKTTRTQKSPRKVLAGLRNAGHDGRTIAAKMRQKFGVNWKALVSA